MNSNHAPQNIMTDETIIAYFLQELSAEECERLEDECFERAEASVEIGAVEEELIEAYLCDELTAERRARVERYYLTTAARRERVAQNAAFLRHVAEYCKVEPTKVAPPAVIAAGNAAWAERWRTLWHAQKLFSRGGAVLAGLVLLAATVWFINRPAAPQTFAVLTLAVQAGSTRSDDGDRTPPQRVKLAPGTDALKVTLQLPANPPPATDYRAELLDTGTRSLPLTAASHDAQTVTFEIPAKQLPRGSYILNLTAIQPDGSPQRLRGSYYFDVER